MRLALLFVVVAIAACSGPPAPSATLGEGDAGLESGIEQRPPAFAVTYEPAELVQPGEEGVECLHVPGPATDVWVNGWQIQRSGLHHVNFWKRALGALPAYDEPTRCGGMPGQYQAGASQPDFVLDLSSERPGAALLLPAAANYLVDAHYLNTGTEPAAKRAMFEFFAAPSHELEISTFTMGGKIAAIPPHTTSVQKFTCTAPRRDIELVTLIGHSHAHSTRVTAAIGSRVVYDSHNWQEPLVGYELGTLPAGTPLTLGCEITNDTDATITAGVDIQTQEMCGLNGLIDGAHWSCAGTPL